MNKDCKIFNVSIVPLCSNLQFVVHGVVAENLLVAIGVLEHRNDWLVISVFNNTVLHSFKYG